MRGGDSKRKQNKKRERGGQRDRWGRERAEIAELIVKVSTWKSSQDSHSATG